jgi:hypothetical protein
MRTVYSPLFSMLRSLPVTLANGAAAAILLIATAYPSAGMKYCIITAVGRCVHTTRRQVTSKHWCPHARTHALTGYSALALLVYTVI